MTTTITAADVQAILDAAADEIGTWTATQRYETSVIATRAADGAQLSFYRPMFPAGPARIAAEDDAEGHYGERGERPSIGATVEGAATDAKLAARVARRLAKLVNTDAADYWAEGRRITERTRRAADNRERAAELLAGVGVSTHADSDRLRGLPQPGEGYLSGQLGDGGRVTLELRGVSAELAAELLATLRAKAERGEL